MDVFLKMALLYYKLGLYSLDFGMQNGRIPKYGTFTQNSELVMRYFFGMWPFYTKLMCVRSEFWVATDKMAVLHCSYLANPPNAKKAVERFDNK